MALEFDDFCYAVENDNMCFKNEILYIFCKQYELDFWGMLEIVDIYIKVNMIERKKDIHFFYVVSLHKRNFEIQYLFK